MTGFAYLNTRTYNITNVISHTLHITYYMYDQRTMHMQTREPDDVRYGANQIDRRAFPLLGETTPEWGPWPGLIIGNPLRNVDMSYITKMFKEC